MQKRYRPNRQSRRGNHQNQNAPTHSGSATSTQGTPSNPQSRPPRPYRPRQESAPVPSYASITIGHGVSVVLKQDQPTGRQVQGLVAEVLTRGDHPRGVKVRLRDGSVGRVQRLVTEDEAARGEAQVGGASANLGRNGDKSYSSSLADASRGARRGGRGGYKHVKDIRDEDEYLYDEGSRPTDMGGFFSALEEADARHAAEIGWGGEAGERPEGKMDMVVCPVCGLFEGDDLAVAHHVEGHFGEGR